MNQCLVWIGFKACGKTSVGELLAEKLGVPFLDTDRLLEVRYVGTKKDAHSFICSQIYRTIGKQAFRNLEKEVIADLPQMVGEPSVIATGGGVVLDPENKALLQQLGKVIYLSASYATLLGRVKSNALPAFMSGDLETEFQTLFAQREPMYREMADRVLNTENYSVIEVVEQLV